MPQNTPAARVGQQPELTLKELVRRHITDRNHVVTDEELRRVKVGVSFPEGLPARRLKRR